MNEHLVKKTIRSFSVPVPVLDDLYIKNVSEITEINWKIFGWTTSLSDTEVSLVRKLPKDFLIISTTLYILVKVRFILHIKKKKKFNYFKPLLL